MPEKQSRNMYSKSMKKEKQRKATEANLVEGNSNLAVDREDAPQASTAEDGNDMYTRVIKKGKQTPTPRNATTLGVGGERGGLPPEEEGLYSRVGKKGKQRPVPSTLPITQDTTYSTVGYSNTAVDKEKEDTYAEGNSLRRVEED